jgi:FkbM family methyltransferase
MNSLLVAEPYALVAARHGTMLVNRNDIYMGQALLAYGECCELESQLLAMLLKMPGLVIEVGANMGIHTIPMAIELARQGRRLLAFEPQRIIFQQLCANLALNGLMNVTALPYALSDESGELVFEVPDYRASGNFGGVSVTDGSVLPAKFERVRSARLDEVTPNEQVGLLKIDVEGHELQVLKGAEGALARWQPILYIENDRAEKSRELIEWLFDQKYRLWWHIPPLYNPANFRGKEENIYPGIHSFNMICLPKDSSIRLTGFQEITDPALHPLTSSSR